MNEIFEKFSMKGQTAVITGAGGLLGREFCKALAQAGADVIAADLNLTLAESTTAEVKAFGGSIIPCQVDVTGPESVRAMVELAVDKTGRLDALVCSAALDPKFDGTQSAHLNSFEEYPLKQWQDALNVNLTGLFLCAQAAVKPMIRQNHGVIINICSTYGLVGPDQRLYERPGQDPSQRQTKPVYYSVTKSGVLGLTKYLATYYAGTGIRANCSNTLHAQSWDGWRTSMN
jgi:2-deoxy-D-gluconate 3-dehydrogenase